MAVALLASGAVAAASPPAPPTASSSGATAAAEPHLADIRRLTVGGENAEAYWSADGKRLIFQRAAPTAESPGGCDQMYVLDLAAGTPARRVSSGLGRDTCGFFFADG